MATIQKTPAGNWRAIIRRKGCATQSKTFAKRALAVRWANEIEAGIEAWAAMPVADRTTLASLIERYIAEITPRKRSAGREASCLRVMSREIGHYALSALTPAVVLSYADQRLKTASADTVRKDLNKLTVVVDAGIALWGVDLLSNPVRTAKSVLKVTKSLSQGERRTRRPTGAELALLLSSHMHLLIEFAVETAMRRGELAAMRWDHVREGGNTLLIPETKTDKARVIPLSARALVILSALIRGGDSVWGVRADSITQAFSRVCAKHNITDLRFHDLRHEGASRLFERGLSIEEVASITGHEDWASLKRYTHLCPSTLAAKLG